MIGNQPIGEIYKTGKLILLAKTKSKYSHAHETRPISILSIALKAIEAMWAYRYENIIWNNIDECQVGFRKNMSTQEQICRLKKWIIKHRTAGIIIFIDVRKAFDNIDRLQVIEHLKKIGIDPIGIETYKKLVKDLQI